MLAYQQLLPVLPALPTQSVEELFFRAVDLERLFGFHHLPPYPAIRPLYPLGAPANGARFTPRGGMASLYLAGDPETAYAEANQVYAKMRRERVSSPVSPAPTVIFSVRTKIDRCLDLSDPTIQAALNTDTRELKRGWLRPGLHGLAATQQLGQAAFDCGQIQALRYASVQNSGHFCYVIFTDRLVGSLSYAEVHDPYQNLTEHLP